MEYIQKLRTLSPEEREKEFKKNSYFIKDSYIVVKNYYENPKIGKVVHRVDKTKVLLKHGSYSEIVKIDNYSPVDKDFYNKVIECHFSAGSQIKNIRTIFKYYLSKIHTLYGEENVDYVEQSSTKVLLTIKHPEITISNEAGQTHKIYDTYIIYFFALYKGYIHPSVSIFRSTATLGELRSNYYLSHTNDSLGRIATSFCFGKNTPLDYYGKGVLKLKFTDLIHYMLLWDNFVATESLEGVPYNYISNIREYKVKNTKYYPTGTDDIIELLKYLPSFSYIIGGENNIVIDVNCVEKALMNLILDKGLKEYLGIRIEVRSNLGIGESHGIPVAFTEEDTKAITIPKGYILFKGEQVHFTLLPSIDGVPLKLPAVEELSPNPNSVQYFLHLLQKEFIPFLQKHLYDKYD